MNKSLEIWVIITILISSSIHPWSPALSGRVRMESFQFADKQNRSMFIKFVDLSITISYHCAYGTSKNRYSRNCMAWKPFELVSTGEYVELYKKFKKSKISKIKTARQLTERICKHTGGTIQTENYEYDPNGRQAELLDFCEYDDGSMMSLISFETYMNKAIR